MCTGLGHFRTVLNTFVNLGDTINCTKRRNRLSNYQLIKLVPSAAYGSQSQQYNGTVMYV
jgi:hypothetical protein